ncbi:MAG: restriction endonuclease [Bacteroidales bacterium]|nr:restriction endonuclease [Bacteroidales bacterium]
MIPVFESFLYPFLLSLKCGELSLKDLRKKLISHFKLTSDDLNIKTRSGKTTQFNDRIGWSRQYLRRAGFIDIPSNGIYRITKRGSDYLSSHDDLLILDLMKYKEFADYVNKGKSKSVPNPEIPFESLETRTPTEQLEQAYATIENDLAVDLLSKVMAQTPNFFEQLVVDLLVKMGYGGSFADSALVTQSSNDEGVDGIIYEDKLGLDKIYIQAKRWKTAVGRPIIQQFSGALAGQNSSKGIFITTSTFSKEAKEYVKGISQKIVLIDGHELARYMIEYNVGVSPKKTYIVKRIDTDYFEE